MVTVAPDRDTVTPRKAAGAVASVPYVPLLCRSCWYFGHSFGWHASPVVCHTRRSPSRFASATSSLPSPSRSPTPAVDTDHPPVNFGQPVGARPPSEYARKSYIADDWSTSGNPSPFTSAMAGVL